MKRSQIRFTPGFRFLFYIAFGALFITGVVWLFVHYAGQGREEFSDGYEWLKPWSLRIHGAAAMITLTMLGFLIPKHMQPAWRQRRNRTTAVVMFTIVMVMIVTGYGLYYCGDEGWRSWLSGCHSAAGLLFPLILIWHVIAGQLSAHKLKSHQRFIRIKA